MIRSIFYLSILSLFTACSGIKVATDYDKTVDFSQFKSYNVKVPTIPQSGAVDPEKISKRNIQAIVDNITKQMDGKGYTKSANPDLWITFYIKIDHKQELRSTNYGYYGGSPYYYGPYYGYNMGFTDVHTVEYTEGTLIIDMIDSKSNNLIWQGVGKKTINENKIDHSEGIRKTVGEIFYRYRFSPAQ